MSETDLLVLYWLRYGTVYGIRFTDRLIVVAGYWLDNS